jgi:hypothetical protein
MGTSLGELFIKYERATNPVTKFVLREIIAKRLDRIEQANKK